MISRVHVKLFVFISMLGFINVYAQDISGYVKGGEGEPLPLATIELEGVFSGVSDIDGYFEVKNVNPKGKQMTVTALGYNKYQQEVFPNNIYDITLVESIESLEEVQVYGATKEEVAERKPYAVDVVPTKELKSFNKDLNQVLNTTSGVNIRESGGLGSEFNLSLNGLSGNQIRYFIDEVPMESFGTSLSLNNFQANLVDNIEIYKGVVPIYLGADALGGAINIVTPSKRKTILDLSYSLGSFNTHRASLFGNYYNKKKKFFVRSMSFYNHSDNNYKMYNVPVFDLILGNELESIDVERFHDDYTSWFSNVQIGVLDKKYADELSLSFGIASNRKNYQHSDNSILNVFGKYHTTDQTSLAKLTYKKTIHKLKLSAYVNAGKRTLKVIDTSTYKFNWTGNSVSREDSDLSGELNVRRSLFVLKDKFVSANLYAGHAINKKNKISISSTYNFLNRKGEDKVDEFNLSFESPNSITKKITGVAYDFQSKHKKFLVTLFSKQFVFKGKIITQDFENNEIVTEPSFVKYGYGGGVSYKINKKLRTKVSVENAYRIPEPYEILGDGIYVNPNSELLPEKSLNLNLGIGYIENINDFKLKVDANLFSRTSKDFIRYNPLGPFGEYENLNDVNSKGIEGSIDVNYDHKISLTLNLTYQNLTDQSPFDEGLINTHYKSRIPNIPYLFGNTRLGYKPIKNLSMYWNTRYVHEFFLTWEDSGDPDNKFTIPGQLLHDFETNYSIQNQYNVSFSITNIFNSLVYDNFNIQKPGRAFAVKLRYTIL